MATRKDYQQAAADLIALHEDLRRTVSPLLTRPVAEATVEVVFTQHVNRVVDTFRRGNPRFDRVKFLAACQMLQGGR